MFKCLILAYFERYEKKPNGNLTYNFQSYNYFYVFYVYKE